MNKFCYPIPVQDDEICAAHHYRALESEVNQRLNPDCSDVETINLTKLVRSIYYFDYLYRYSDDNTVVVNREQQYHEIIDEIEALPDVLLSAYLRSKFDIDRYKDISEVLPWAEYFELSKPDLLYLLERGKSLSDIARLRGLASAIGRKILYNNVSTSNINHNAICYTNNTSRFFKDYESNLKINTPYNSLIAINQGIYKAIDELAKAIVIDETILDDLNQLSSLRLINVSIGVDRLPMGMRIVSLYCYNMVIYMPPNKPRAVNIKDRKSNVYRSKVRRFNPRVM